MKTKTEVVELSDLKKGDDVTFHFTAKKGINATQDGIVDIINTPIGTCVIRTGEEAVRIMNDWFLILRRPKPVPPKPKKKKIWEIHFFDMQKLNEWWNENDVEIITINNNGGYLGSTSTVYYYEK
jgi:hypothetical protein